MGAALTGMRPVVDIHFADFVTTAMDEIVNQMAKIHYMFGGQAKLPMVLWTPDGGGIYAAAQHSQSLENWFVHTPGLKVVVPSEPKDVKGLLKAAIRDDNPVIFMEHKLLYNSREPVDKHSTRVIPLGRGRRETDTARAAAAHIADWISIPMGVSTLHDRFGHIRDDAQRFAMMSLHFEERLAPFEPYDKDLATTQDKLQIIGVSGTATTFGALHLGLRTYDRNQVDGLWLPADGAADIADRLLSMGGEDRADHPGIGRGRSDLVISGAAILMTILRLWPVERLRIADRGLREGILYGLLQARRDRKS